MKLYEVLRELREKRGLKKVQVSNESGITYSTYCNYESGFREPNSDVLTKLAKFYGVTVDSILGIENEDDDLYAYLEELKHRPEMRMLFKTAKTATKKDVETAVKIIETLKEQSENGGSDY